jgi:hypothetical protein
MCASTRRPIGILHGRTGRPFRPLRHRRTGHPPPRLRTEESSQPWVPAFPCALRIVRDRVSGQHQSWFGPLAFWVVGGGSAVQKAQDVVGDRLGLLEHHFPDHLFRSSVSRTPSCGSTPLVPTRLRSAPNEHNRATSERQRSIPDRLGSHYVRLDEAALGCASAHQSRDPRCHGFCARRRRNERRRIVTGAIRLPGKGEA